MNFLLHIFIVGFVFYVQASDEGKQSLPSQSEEIVELLTGLKSELVETFQDRLKTLSSDVGREVFNSPDMVALHKKALQDLEKIPINCSGDFDKVEEEVQLFTRNEYSLAYRCKTVAAMASFMKKYLEDFEIILSD